MHKLYHFPLCPFSRKVRVVLAEKGINYDLVLQKFWEKKREFSKLNPAMQVPVLLEPNGHIVSDSVAICEYIDEVYKTEPLFGTTPSQKAEVRRVVAWYDQKFYDEVTKYLLKEKILRFVTKTGTPNSDAIRAANSNVATHLKYIEYLLDENDSRWLLGDKISMADIAAAAQISVADYLDAVNWDNFAKAKEWYALIKSRPSFRQLLQDRIAGLNPPKHYDNPDF